MKPPEESTAQTVERVFRHEYGRILATLIRVFGDFDLAEDALQEAFIAAVTHWQSAGTLIRSASCSMWRRGDQAMEILA